MPVCPSALRDNPATTSANEIVRYISSQRQHIIIEFITANVTVDQISMKNKSGMLEGHESPNREIT